MQENNSNAMTNGGAIFLEPRSGSSKEVPKANNNTGSSGGEITMELPRGSAKVKHHLGSNAAQSEATSAFLESADYKADLCGDIYIL